MSDWELQVWMHSAWAQAVLLANAANSPLAVDAVAWEQHDDVDTSESQEDGFPTDKLLQVAEKALAVLERVTRVSTAGGLRVQLAGVKNSFEHVCRVAAFFGMRQATTVTWRDVVQEKCLRSTQC